MQVPNFVQMVENEKAREIMHYPNEYNRASGIGYAVPMLDGCLRRGVYDRTHWDKKELHDVKAQFIFDEGHHQERQVLRDLDKANVKIIMQQTPFTIFDQRPDCEGEILLRGTIEGKIEISEEAGHAKDLVTFEIKSMNPNIFRQMETFEDFRKKPWTLAYMAQIMSYMIGEDESIGLFILKDKSNGTLRQIEVPLDYELGGEILKACMQINDHVKAKTLPPRRNDVDKCVRCPHKAYCLPDIDFEVGPSVADDPDLENKITRYMEIKDTGKEADKLWKEAISQKMKVTAAGKDMDVILGKWRLKGKTASNGTFRGKVLLNEEALDEELKAKTDA